ncbi:transposase family protein [Streptomyces sp. NPDC058475]|uniref:transposase family protein n=1 Tax=Streptomyces sp. NPDC058475 TaxID=3346518 RepID=UPI00364748D3
MTGQLTARRRKIGTRWRRLSAARQALLALAHLRCGDTYAQLAAGFGIGIATVYGSSPIRSDGCSGPRRLCPARLTT